MAPVQAAWCLDTCELIIKKCSHDPIINYSDWTHAQCTNQVGWQKQHEEAHATHKQARARVNTYTSIAVCWAHWSNSDVYFNKHWSNSAVVADAAATQESLQKCGRQGGDKEITISHSAREPILFSNRRTFSCPQEIPHFH